MRDCNPRTRPRFPYQLNVTILRPSSVLQLIHPGAECDVYVLCMRPYNDALILLSQWGRLDHSYITSYWFVLFNLWIISPLVSIMYIHCELTAYLLQANLFVAYDALSWEM